MAAALPDELVEQIFFRLPHDDPSHLICASLVCKPWRKVVSDPSFLARLHKVRRAPLMLGFLLDTEDERFPGFFPTSAFSLPAPDHRSWLPRDCRHGRALFCSDVAREFLVWEPATGTEWVVPVPAAYEHLRSNSAVLCAADGCDHRHCQGGPFRVVLLFSEQTGWYDWASWASVYSSETGAWCEPTSINDIASYYARPNVLLGNSMLYFLTNGGSILEYDLARHHLASIDPGRDIEMASREDKICLMVSEKGGLGIAEADDDDWIIYLWSMEVSDDGYEDWLVTRRIFLTRNNLVPSAALSGWGPTMAGFAEEAKLIFMSTNAGIFVIDFQFGGVRKVCHHNFSFHLLVPIVSLGCELGAPLSEYHYPPPSPTCSELEEEEELLERAQQMFIKGSKSIEERNFVDAVECLSQALENR